MFSIQGGEDLEDCLRFSGHLSRRYASHSDASFTHPLGRGSPAAFLLGKRTIALGSAMSVKRAMLTETTGLRELALISPRGVCRSQVSRIQLTKSSNGLASTEQHAENRHARLSRRWSGRMARGVRHPVRGAA